ASTGVRRYGRRAVQYRGRAAVRRSVYESGVQTILLQLSPRNRGRWRRLSGTLVRESQNAAPCGSIDPEPEIFEAFTLSTASARTSRSPAPRLTARGSTAAFRASQIRSHRRLSRSG